MIRLKYQPPPIHPAMENGEENQVLSKHKKTLRDTEEPSIYKKILSETTTSFLPSQTQQRRQELFIHSREADYRTSVMPSVDQRIAQQRDYVREQLDEVKYLQQDLFTKREIEEIEKNSSLNVNPNDIKSIKIRIKEKNNNNNKLVKKFIMDYDAKNNYDDDEDYYNNLNNDDEIDLSNTDPQYLKYVKRKNKEKDDYFESKYDDEKLLELHLKQLQEQLDLLEKEEEEEIMLFHQNNANNLDAQDDDNDNANNALKDKINHNILQLIKIKQQKIYSTRKKNYKVSMRYNNENSHPYHLKYHNPCSYFRAFKYAMEVSLFGYTYNFPKLMHTSIYMKQTKTNGSHYVCRDEKNKGYKNYTYILPWLILGKKNAVQDLGVLLKLEISHILNLTYEITNLFPNHFIYERIPIKDDEKANIGRYFNKICDFIHQAGSSKGRILVHCVAGASRAPSAILAYLIKYHQLSLYDSLQYLTAHRSIIRPNRSFLLQLALFENKVLEGSSVLQHLWFNFYEFNILKVQYNMKENFDVKGLFQTVLYLFHNEKKIKAKKMKELELNKSINKVL